MAFSSASGGGGGDSAYGSAKTSVWWDIENCQVPPGRDAYMIAQNISSALADAGYMGAVTISAYGDTNKIPTAVQQAISSTGIALNHVPAGVKDASDKKILVDMLFWAVDNPPPANYLLISGDRDFSNALHQLRMRRYNILLAHAPNVSQALAAAAGRVWLWTSLLAGGPPLQNSDLHYPRNAAGGSSTCADAGQKTVGDTIPSKGSSGMRKEDSSFIGRDDNQYSGNMEVWRNQILPTGNINRVSSLAESQENHSLQFQKQMPMPVVLSSEAYASTQQHTTMSPPCSSTQMPHGESGVSFQSEGKQFNQAPHEFFGANKHRASVVSSGKTVTQPTQTISFKKVGLPTNVQLPSLCHFCHKRGHNVKDCRYQQKLCFACGASDHVVKNCSQRGMHLSSQQHVFQQAQHNLPEQPTFTVMAEESEVTGQEIIDVDSD